MFHKYDKNAATPFRTRSKGESDSAQTWEHYVLIYHFVMSKGLSQKDGQDLLDLFHNLHAVSRLTTPVSLPTYISIHNAMTKEKNVGLTEFIEHFPQDYFGVDSGLKPFKGVHFNILERIAEVCYFADPLFFVPSTCLLSTNQGKE